MVYSAWGKNGIADTFIEGDVLPAVLQALEPALERIRLLTADSWDDAMRQYHEWQGWEPYRPMD
jgi:hypothetical protein